MKTERVRLIIDGKVTDRAKLTKDAPRIVWYTEHSVITEQLSKGKSKRKAKARYLERAAREIQAAALEVIEDLSRLDKRAANKIVHDYFIRWPLEPVTFEDGEPVQLEDFEEA